MAGAADEVDKLSLEEDQADDYKPPEAKSVEELLASKEGEDDALRRYKEQLLGAAAAGGAKTNDPRRVVVTEVGVLFEDGHTPVILDMTDASAPKKVVIKEACKYKLQCMRH